MGIQHSGRSPTLHPFTAWGEFAIDTCIASCYTPLMKNMGGKFNRVLFVRVDDELLAKIDALVERVRLKSRNPVSRSAVIRDLLWDGTKAELEAWDAGSGS